MSTHPNVILMLVLTPDDLSRKTARDILEANEGELYPDEGVYYLQIDRKVYHLIIMETDYEEDLQISANVGDIVIYDLVTYGYGDRIRWGDLLDQKNRLQDWADQNHEKYHFSYEVWVGANYW